MRRKRASAPGSSFSIAPVRRGIAAYSSEAGLRLSESGGIGCLLFFRLPFEQLRIVLPDYASKDAPSARFGPVSEQGRAGHGGQELIEHLLCALPQASLKLASF